MSSALTEVKLPTTPEEAKQQRESISRALRRAARQANAPIVMISGGASYRARRGDRAFRLGLIISFLLFALAPLLVESIYWGLIASNQYVTDTKFAVVSSDSQKMSAAGIVPGTTASGVETQSTQIVANYITSRAMVDALAQQVGLRRLYSRSDIDYFSRFDAKDPTEELEKYWANHVDVSVDAYSGIVSVSVRAFSSVDSLRITNKLIELSETLARDLMTRTRRDALARAKSELDRAERRLEENTNAMRDARNAHGVLDVGASSQALTNVISQLQLNQSTLEQNLAALGPTSTNSPAARVLKLQIDAVKLQIADYNKMLGTTDPGRSSKSLAARADPLSMASIELDLARQLYTQASVNYQNARIDLEKHHAYLVTFLKPTQAEEATYPRRLREWSIVVIPCFIGWGVLVSLAFIARDNMAR